MKGREVGDGVLRGLCASSAVTSGLSNTRWRRIATTSSQTLHPANSSPQKNPTKNNPPGAHTATATGIAISATMMRAGRGFLGLDAAGSGTVWSSVFFSIVFSAASSSWHSIFVPNVIFSYGDFA
ncbi:hypothetical protein [Bifidobacterium thermophilum]|uniref:hypothetical protein n=1 Tax=Bifidobacterium thermophilum TaxID=33905 RepID=UPI00145953BF|nr:hypothetical protein [Bifidobacterium thermophilum]